ncbi:MAG TPA: hypothetical protein VH880_04135 [Anaeromyxobacteraceae bacterium]
MADAVQTGQAAPFASAAELRAGHEGLLEAIDAEVGEDASAAAEAAALARHEEEIRAFLERGAATGVFLDEVKDRTACQVLLDYWAVARRQAGRGAVDARLARFDGAQLPVLRDEDCPYVGLEAFRSPTYFFGREGDTRALASQIRATPLVVVLGASGSGKSSLVMGGVLPALAGSQGPPLRVLPPFVPGIAALEALVAAVRGEGEAAGTAAADVERLRGDPGALLAALGGAGAPATLVTIDQFEEVFTLAGAADREVLVACLARLIAAGGGHRVLLTMREEFRSRMVELRALAPHLDQAWYSMRPMSYDELRAAAERPASLANLHFQAGIVDDLVKKVLGQPAALPLLQFTLRSLWDHRRRNRITWEVYGEVGDPLHALRAAADRFHDGLAPETQDEVRRILLELVRVDELLEAYRQPVRRSQVLRAGKANTEAVLDLLARYDFIRVSPGDVVELKHEALVRNWPRLVGWIDQKRVERRQRLALAQAAGRWEASGRPEEGLLTGWQLQEARRFPDLSDLEQDFVQASADAVDRARRAREETLEREAEQARALAKKERRRRRLAVAALAVLSVLYALAGVGAVRLEEEAKTQRLEKADLQAKKERLEAQKDSLEKEKAELQEKNRQLLAQLSSGLVKAVGTPAGAGSSPVTIHLYLSAEDQRPRAQEIARRLEESGIRVSGIDRKEPATQSDVRYFRSADRQEAERIAALLNAYLVGETLPIQATLYKLDRRTRDRKFDIWFAQGTLGSAAKAAEPSGGAGRFYVVLSNDTDCPKAVDSYAAAARAMASALGRDFRKGDLKLLRGSFQGREYLVTAYGGLATAEAARETARRAVEQPGVRPDVYVARGQTYREQKTCAVGGEVLSRLRGLAKDYTALRGSLPAGPQRTTRMAQLAWKMQVAAAGLELDPKAVADLHRGAEDPEGSRVAALALIRSAPAPVHLPLVLQSIESPLPGAAFEQFQALAALSEMEAALSAEQRREARRALESAWAANALDIRGDPSRKSTAERLRKSLARSSAGEGGSRPSR